MIILLRAAFIFAGIWFFANKYAGFVTIQFYIVFGCFAYIISLLEEIKDERKKD